MNGFRQKCSRNFKILRLSDTECSHNARTGYEETLKKCLTESSDFPEMVEVNPRSENEVGAKKIKVLWESMDVKWCFHLKGLNDYSSYSKWTWLTWGVQSLTQCVSCFEALWTAFGVIWCRNPPGIKVILSSLLSVSSSDIQITFMRCNQKACNVHLELN